MQVRQRQDRENGRELGGRTQDGLRELGQLCDFCGDRVTTVRRVALDWDYDRLQMAHNEQYSCSSCFDSKEERRMGMGRR